ncbi:MULTISPECIES: hypothetical protein [Nitrospirillum]|uniref:Uncharacterized protein n=1 Tax=Nitrospirillum amazonense TaxID=28077 RepID=A0A560FN13_9PROT|nr:hypothetical protein [Nitrospirillum amazonense]MEC4591572.1 hypothetical protein [Nitrospirillum amazonense]TWB22960.1 hypothetical protein FBZ88_115108 [Nitrospirillum amazonense]
MASVSRVFAALVLGGLVTAALPASAQSLGVERACGKAPVAPVNHLSATASAAEVSAATAEVRAYGKATQARLACLDNLSARSVIAWTPDGRAAIANSYDRTIHDLKVVARDFATLPAEQVADTAR